MSLAPFSVVSSQKLGGFEKYTDSSIATKYIPKTAPIIAAFVCNISIVAVCAILHIVMLFCREQQKHTRMGIGMSATQSRAEPGA